MSAERIADRDARVAALDPARSFIVQAPAGSGKTGLLTQRYLRLLALVAAPEEVLAITFTRKAAGEMRERIIGALTLAAADEPPADDHQAITRELARRVLVRDAELGWGLLRYPARLRIQTIDAFNASLTRQMPLLSGLGAPPAITDDARALYAQAAANTITLLEQSDTQAWSDAITVLLLHLDNRMDRARDMLAGMLAKREQWLRVLLPSVGGERADGEQTHARDRSRLEQAIATELQVQIAAVAQRLPVRFHDEIVAMAAFAGRQLEDSGRKSPLRACIDMTAMPAADPSQLAQWQGIAELLLTKSGSWRRTVRVDNGFPPGCADDKARMLELLAGLAAHAAPAAQLSLLRQLPPPRYDDEQWRLIEAFADLLRLAAAQLQLVFAGKGEVDHAEIALRALRALGDDEQPTDLALALDHRIQHILVDEFQDTATGQYLLLTALTRGWTPGDGRSLFVVGDPMQSIYAFREAEVGLFISARHEGLAGLPLIPLRLNVNFRSSAQLVGWVNDVFPEILSPVEDAASGAVRFEQAAAFREAGDGGVAVHPLMGERPDSDAEAVTVVELARRRLAETDQGTVAILVRRRKDVAAILPALRAAGIRYQAVDIESLATRPVVQDLIALTRSLVHPGDRTAWLAVLRAPWCGLSLQDMLVVAGEDRHEAVSERIMDGAVAERLSSDGRARMERVRPVLHTAIAQRRRGTVRQRVEAAWYALGGPAAAGSRAALEDAEAFLSLLEATESGGDLDDINSLDEALANLFARPDPDGDERLQVMTIHKAKGLEFDTVILPGLHAGQGSDATPLLRWMQRPRRGAIDLLLAPVRADGEARHDPIYELIGALEKEKREHEQGRLLYVAVTRAVRRLDLVGFARTRGIGADAQLASPPAGSMLGRLWPFVEPAFLAALEGGRSQPPADAASADDALAEPPRLRRLIRDWRLPPAPPTVSWRGGVVETDTAETDIEFEWAGQTARQIGLVVHRMLQRIADEGLSAWDDERLSRCEPVVRAMLAGHGTDPATLDSAQRRVRQAVANVLADPSGRWILAPWQGARNELALTSMGRDGPETSIIDRTFVDDTGTRWVVDYKTGYRAGGDVDGFLGQEADRYRPALARYANLLELREPGTPIRVALYFPLLVRLHEVDVTGAPSPDA